MSDRTGEVWEIGGTLLLIVKPGVWDKHLRAWDHQALFLMDGRLGGAYEWDSAPWGTKEARKGYGAKRYK